ncbi:MAG TPA: DNA ligase (NAD(+)) LigA, partial [Rikenellaceae bacterium]|nr:DNA ligase (NAD(+)) LigA [Rikenellaceae bacterium]
MTIVISGNFSISRDAMKELIASHGGKASSSISKKTAFLISGTKAGPEKLKKCEELGVKVLTEEQFRQMLPDTGVPQGSKVEELTLF